MSESRGQRNSLTSNHDRQEKVNYLQQTVKLFNIHHDNALNASLLRVRFI